MPKGPSRDLGDHEVLTHYGTADRPWRDEPRIEEGDLSMICGKLSGVEAGNVVRFGGALDDGTERARWTTVGTLREAGFVVTHTPSNRNPNHVSVTCETEWSPEAFKSCFGSTVDSIEADGLEDGSMGGEVEP